MKRKSTMIDVDQPEPMKAFFVESIGQNRSVGEGQEKFISKKCSAFEGGWLPEATRS